MDTLILSEELTSKIKDHIKYDELIYVDYRDSLDDDLQSAQKIINDGNIDDKISDWYLDSELDSLDSIMKSIQKEFDLTDQFIEDNNDALREIIYGVCSNDPTKDLIKHTGKLPVRLEALSNYEGIRNNYSIGSYLYEEGFKQIVDMLELNPSTLQSHMNERGFKTEGDWPEFLGDPYVSQNDFIQELRETISQCNCLTFLGTVDLMEFYIPRKEGEKIFITIPKGNPCGLFDSACGSGSLLEMKLLRDFTADITTQWGETSYDNWRFGIDDVGGYSIGAVYGVGSDYFKDEVGVTIL